jgi:hypothetical protein
VDGLPGDPHDKSITKAVVALGRTLDLTVVALVELLEHDSRLATGAD